VNHKTLPSVLWHCWLGDRKGIQSVKRRVLVCWWWHFDWRFARLNYAPAVTTISTILSSNKFQNGDILVPANNTAEHSQLFIYVATPEITTCTWIIFKYSQETIHKFTVKWNNHTLHINRALQWPSEDSEILNFKNEMWTVGYKDSYIKTGGRRAQQCMAYWRFSSCCYRENITTTFGFLFNGQFFHRSLQVKPSARRSHKEPLGITGARLSASQMPFLSSNQQH